MFSMHSAVPGVSPVGRRRRAMEAGLVVLVAVFVACRGPAEPDGPITWTALSAGSFYNCGLARTGDAYCWGGVGGYFEMPSPQDSIIPNSAVPWVVPGKHQFSHISAGSLVMCALDLARRAFCWGGNTYGEIGDLSTVAKRGPSAVVGGFVWRTIAAGGAHVCAITVESVTYCWGNNFRGALGLGNDLISGGSGEPLPVAGGVTFVQVWTATGRSCALTAEGYAYCWGVNDDGVLGDGRTPEPGAESATPVRVVGDHRFSSLAMGGAHTCGITLDARAFCWGWNRYGQLGDDTHNSSSSPVPVLGDLQWASLSAGEFHTCGLTMVGSAYCWGSNENGQFGTGATGTASVPQLVGSAGTYVEVAAGGRHTCGRTSAGTAFCWGRGDFGQLGHGFMRDELRPVPVARP